MIQTSCYISKVYPKIGFTLYIIMEQIPLFLITPVYMQSMDHRFNYSSVTLRSPANKTLESIKKIPTSGPSRSPTPPAWLSSSANSSHLLSHRLTHFHFLSLYVNCIYVYHILLENCLILFVFFFLSCHRVKMRFRNKRKCYAYQNKKRAWGSIAKKIPYCYSAKEYEYEYKLRFSRIFFLRLQCVLWMLLLKRFMMLETFPLD